jgi:hypothetical protein
MAIHKAIYAPMTIVTLNKIGLPSEVERNRDKQRSACSVPGLCAIYRSTSRLLRNRAVSRKIGVKVESCHFSPLKIASLEGTRDEARQKLISI